MTTAKDIVLRTSERHDFKRCQQRWHWAWRQGLKPKKENDKLIFGQGIHYALAEWYQSGTKRGEHPAKTFLKWFKDEQTYVKTRGVLIDDVEWVEARELGAAMLVNYVDTFGDDKEWEFISTEQTVQAQIKMLGMPNNRIVYTGTFDGVFRMNADGTLWLLENKTAASIPSTGYLELDDQAGTYFMLAESTLRHQGLIRSAERLEGIMYNFLRKAMPDDRPQNQWGQYLNKDGSVSKRQGGPLFLRFPVWRSDSQRSMMQAHIMDEARQMQMLRERMTNVTKTPTRDCSWDCSFFQMCQLHEAGEDWLEFRDAMYVRKDPYADHRANLKSA